MKWFDAKVYCTKEELLQLLRAAKAFTAVERATREKASGHGPVDAGLFDGFIAKLCERREEVDELLYRFCNI